MTHGAFTHPRAAWTGLGAGLRTNLGLLLPPSGELVAYVRGDVSGNRVVYDGDHQNVIDKLYPTLNAALGKCRSGRGDIVVVLEGHAEYISTADQMSGLVAGTKIIGLGHGTNRPTFRFTATGSSFLLDVANVIIENCIFDLCHTANAGVTVGAPFTVSAAGCGFHNCLFRMDGDANDLCTIGITTTTAADYFEFIGNQVLGAVAAVCTTFLALIGADRCKIWDNEIDCATSAVAVGPIRFSGTASLDISMLRNRIKNRLASSTAAVTCMAGVTGFVDHLTMHVLSNGADALVLGHADGAWAAATGDVSFGRFINVSNLVGERAAEVTVVSA